MGMMVTKMRSRSNRFCLTVLKNPRNGRAGPFFCCVDSSLDENFVRHLWI